MFQPLRRCKVVGWHMNVFKFEIRKCITLIKTWFSLIVICFRNITFLRLFIRTPLWWQTNKGPVGQGNHLNYAWNHINDKQSTVETLIFPRRFGTFISTNNELLSYSHSLFLSQVQEWKVPRNNVQNIKRKCLFRLLANYSDTLLQNEQIYEYYLSSSSPLGRVLCKQLILSFLKMYWNVRGTKDDFFLWQQYIFM